MNEFETLFYCKFRGVSSGKSFNQDLIDWTVNGDSVKGYSQFRIINYNNVEDDTISYLQILNPVAMRGSTNIKCSVKSASRTFSMNS